MKTQNFIVKDKGHLKQSVTKNGLLVFFFFQGKTTEQPLSPLLLLVMG